MCFFLKDDKYVSGEYFLVSEVIKEDKLTNIRESTYLKDLIDETSLFTLNDKLSETTYKDKRTGSI